MWRIKKWKLSEKEKYLAWLGKNMSRYQITTLFVNNGYGVEYRPLVKL